MQAGKIILVVPLNLFREHTKWIGVILYNSRYQYQSNSWSLIFLQVYFYALEFL